jgi:cysteine desulfurase
MLGDVIYLDCNSTTPIDPRVLEAMAAAWRDFPGNPASQHGVGRRARRRLEEAREAIGELLGAKVGAMDADRVVFTSGGTEANCLAILGEMLDALCRLVTAESRGRCLAVSAVEHPSVFRAAEVMTSRDADVDVWPVGHDGILDFEWSLDPGTPSGRGSPTATHSHPDPAIVSVILASNETGVIQPVQEIAKRCREFRALMHTDAVQAVGKIPVHFRELGVDAMTVAPHKFHGPIGIGALVLRQGIELQPGLFGGFQQGGLRPGTEGVALAVGFEEALRIAVSDLEARAARMRLLRDDLERRLKTEIAGMVVIGESVPRLPNTSCVSFPGMDRQALVMALDLAGVACSTGSACASGSSEPSPTLIAMGLEKAVVEGAIRLSLSAFTTAEEVVEAARRIIKAVKHLRGAK